VPVQKTDIININDNNQRPLQAGDDGSEPALTATPVPDEQRLPKCCGQNSTRCSSGTGVAVSAGSEPSSPACRGWPQHFGNIPQWITLEPQVFAWMDRFCADYSGGIWALMSAALPFLVLNSDQKASLSVSGAMKAPPLLRGLQSVLSLTVITHAARNATP
jgi:hypothetical protein